MLHIQQQVDKLTIYFIILLHRFSQIDYLAISIFVVASYIIHSFFGESGSSYTEYLNSSLIKTRMQTFRVSRSSVIAGDSTTLHLGYCFICSMEDLVFLGSAKLWFGFSKVSEVWSRFANNVFGGRHFVKETSNIFRKSLSS